MRAEGEAIDDPPLLHATGVTKKFGAVTALDRMRFELRAGEVHVLFGENGAGKSTLINIIAGAISPDEGEIRIEGNPVVLPTVHVARELGIAAMFQEFSLAPDLSVEENIFLGAEPSSGIFIKTRERRQRVKEALAKFRFDLNPATNVNLLSRAQQQMVEMAKALLTDPKILILDEPTASLSQRETEAMFSLVRGLRDAGVGIIYITHRIKEIKAIGDRVTVMRDGQFIDTVEVEHTGEHELVQLMTGRSIENFYPHIDHSPGEVMLEVNNLKIAAYPDVEVSLDVRAGEVVGLAGLVGCGKSRIARAIFGVEPSTSASIKVNGEQVRRAAPRRMLERGVAYITSDRRNEGLMLLRPTKENLTLPSLSGTDLSQGSWLRLKEEKRFAQSLGERMQVKPLELGKNVIKYSGGNQQKVMIAKALGRATRVLLFDEPTVGIDVAARVEVYSFIKELVEEGSAVVIVSSDLPEVLNMSHRLLVVRDGEIVDQLERDEISESRVLHGFFGTGTDQHQAQLAQ